MQQPVQTDMAANGSRQKRSRPDNAVRQSRRGRERQATRQDAQTRLGISRSRNISRAADVGRYVYTFDFEKFNG